MASRLPRYRSFVDRAGLVLGLRPENIADRRGPLTPGQETFETTLDVTEPLGMDTLVHFTVNGIDVCGRVSSVAGTQAGQRFTLVADMAHMHLIDDDTGRVI